MIRLILMESKPFKINIRVFTISKIKNKSSPIKKISKNQNYSTSIEGKESRFNPKLNNLSLQSNNLLTTYKCESSQIRKKEAIVTDRTRNKWSRDDDLKLMNLVDRYGENFDSLSSYFPKKTSQDLAIRYYKKIKHVKISFNEEEDRLINKLYRCEALNLDELETLQKKDPVSVNHRLKILLRDQQEEMRKDFNVSSTLSRIRIAATKATSRTESQTYLSKENYNFSHYNKDPQKSQPYVPKKQADNENIIESVNPRTKRDYDAMNPFEKTQIFKVRHKGLDQSDHEFNQENFQSIITYKKYSEEETTFIEGLSINNLSNQQQFNLNNTCKNIDNFFEALDTGQYYDNMISESEAQEKSLNFSHILELGRNYENISEKDLELVFKEMEKDQTQSETLRNNEYSIILQSLRHKKDNFEVIINKFNNLSCAMEREFYYKLSSKSRENLAKIKEQESSLFRELIDVKMKISGSKGMEISDYIVIIKSEIDIQLKLIYLNKRKLDILSLNI